MRSTRTPGSTARLPIAILGVPFDNITSCEALEAISGMITSGQPHYLATANVDFLVQAGKDLELRRILCSAHMVLCDGTPVLWASRLLGNPLPERVAGSDLVPLLIALAAERNYRVFFLGASPHSAKLAVHNLKERHPNLLIAGYYSPPFNPILDMDHEEIHRRVREARPDLLLVSFGCPKQEKWIAMHYRTLGVPVSVGVGATIDFLAGEMKRAPRWMQRSGTEWTFRLMQEPRRLFGRYVKDCWVFAWAILAQWWRLQARGWRGGLGRKSAVPLQAAASWQCIEAPPRLDLVAARDGVLRVEEIAMDGRDCLLEMSGVEFMDSTGVGVLIRLQNRLGAAGRQLVLEEPSPAVQRVLKLMHLEDVFACSPDHETAALLLQTRQAEEADKVSVVRNASSIVFFWRGEVVAANAEEIWRQTREQLVRLADSALIIDLTAVRFIDSSGLGVMVRARKLALQQRVTLTFKGFQPAVRNIVRLARLHDFFVEGKPAPLAGASVQG